MALLIVSLPVHAALALALGLPEDRAFTCNSDADREDPYTDASQQKQAIQA